MSAVSWISFGSFRKKAWVVTWMSSGWRSATRYGRRIGLFSLVRRVAQRNYEDEVERLTREAIEDGRHGVFEEERHQVGAITAIESEELMKHLEQPVRRAIPGPSRELDHVVGQARDEAAGRLARAGIARVLKDLRGASWNRDRRRRLSAVGTAAEGLDAHASAPSVAFAERPKNRPRAVVARNAGTGGNSRMARVNALWSAHRVRGMTSVMPSLGQK